MADPKPITFEEARAAYVFMGDSPKAAKKFRLAEIALRAYVVAFAEAVGDNPEFTQRWVDLQIPGGAS